MEHSKVITTKINKAIILLGKLNKIAPRPVLMTICKASVRPYLGYGDVIFDEEKRKHFISNLNLFSIILAFPYRELLEEPQEKNIFMN